MAEVQPVTSAIPADAAPEPAVAAGAESEETPREALIYLGGLSSESGKSVTGVVARIADALDKADTSMATWRVHWSDAAVRRTEAPVATTPLATIYRKTEASELPVLDIFHYDWSKRLMDDWEGRSLFRRTLSVLFSLIKFWEYPAKFGAAAKTARGKMQLLVAMIMLAAMVFYAGALLFAGYQTVRQVWDSTAGDEKVTATTTTIATTTTVAGVPAADPAEGPADTSGATTWQRLVIIGGLGVATFKKQGDRLRASGGALTAADHYVRLGARRHNLAGELQALCEGLSKTGRHPTVRFVGYSFGAIVAIDTLFPTTAVPVGSLQAVNGLTTIGAPYDFVHAIRSDWRDNRYAGSSPPVWINIYSPTDVLGSNFRDDNQDGVATRGIAVTAADSGIQGGAPQTISPSSNLTWSLGVKLTFRNLIMLTGFTNHSEYWGDDAEVDHNVFDDLVLHMYAGTSVLGNLTG